MKIVFMGTPEFARVCLQALLDDGQDVVAVITQPDKPAGRGKKLQMSAVKAYALEQGLPVFQPERANRGDFPAQLESFDADIFVVAAFGQILSQRVLDIPRFGAINVHASLLPKYRGAAPIQQAILDGEATTGLTIMQMDAGMDTGDMLLKRELAIAAEDTGGSLHDKLCALAPEALLTALQEISTGKATAQKQDPAQASYAPMITKEMTKINFSKQSPQEIVNMVRGYNPFPGAVAEIGGKSLKIWRAALSNEEPRLCPKGGMFVQAKVGTVQILELTPPSGKKMSATDYIKGLKT